MDMYVNRIMYTIGIVNYRNEQHYIIQDSSTQMTYAVYVTRGYIAGSVCMILTPHAETVYNIGRMVCYERNTIMYNSLYAIISDSLGDE